MKSAWAARALAALTFLSASAPADQAPASEPVQQSRSATGDPELDSVTVTAKRRREIIEQRISRFVSSIAIRSHTESLARWQVPICFFVAGASSSIAEFIQKRVLQIATDAGVPAAAGDCKPNFVIVLTPEPEELLRSWWSEAHQLFNKDRGVGGIERFIESEEVIRAWYNACSVSPTSSKQFVMKGGPDCGTGAIDSRLTWESVRSIYSVIVVVDLQRIEDLNVGQLSDYVAMIGLAQIRRDAELDKIPTILNLLAAIDTARPQSMSSWDRSFLQSLYDTDSENVTHVSQIKSSMKRELLP